MKPARRCAIGAAAIIAAALGVTEARAAGEPAVVLQLGTFPTEAGATARLEETLAVLEETHPDVAGRISAVEVDGERRYDPRLTFPRDYPKGDLCAVVSALAPGECAEFRPIILVREAPEPETTTHGDDDARAGAPGHTAGANETAVASSEAATAKEVVQTAVVVPPPPPKPARLEKASSTEAVPPEFADDLRARLNATFGTQLSPETGAPAPTQEATPGSRDPVRVPTRQDMERLRLPSVFATLAAPETPIAMAAALKTVSAAAVSGSPLAVVVGEADGYAVLAHGFADRVETAGICGAFMRQSATCSADLAERRMRIGPYAGFVEAARAAFGLGAMTGGRAKVILPALADGRPVVAAIGFSGRLDRDRFCRVIAESGVACQGD